MRGDIIEILRDIFIAVLYIFGIGFFGFFAMFLFVLALKMWQGRK